MLFSSLENQIHRLGVMNFNQKSYIQGLLIYNLDLNTDKSGLSRPPVSCEISPPFV